MNISSIAVDDFYPAPDAVRRVAGLLSYETKEHEGHKYNGIGLGYSPEKVNDYLSALFGTPTKIEMEYFRLGTPNEPPTTYIHADACIGDWAAVWYLSEPPAGVVAGTAFWRHKELGLTSLPSEDWAKETFSDKENPVQYCIDLLDKDGMDETKWDMVGLIGQKFNRIACYKSKLFHSRFPYSAWGTGANDGRVVWTAFFNTV